jgi:hypothetical protein
MLLFREKTLIPAIVTAERTAKKAKAIPKTALCVFLTVSFLSLSLFWIRQFSHLLLTPHTKRPETEIPPMGPPKQKPIPKPSDSAKRYSGYSPKKFHRNCSSGLPDAAAVNEFLWFFLKKENRFYENGFLAIALST